MKRLAVFLFGGAAYAVALLTVLYGVGFVGGIGVPKSIDTGRPSASVGAWAVDVSLLALFGLQHSGMARRAFKRGLARLIPGPAERSLFVLLASLSLLLLFWQWRPLGPVVWDISTGWIQAAVRGLFWAGWAVFAVSTFLIDHLDLFGLRQVYLYLRGRAYTPVPFRQPAFYRYVRHPMMLGLLVAFWASPRMSAGHMLFAAGMSAYALVGIALEERDLRRAHGEAYAAYRRQVPMLLPRLRRRRMPPAEALE